MLLIQNAFLRVRRTPKIMPRPSDERKQIVAFPGRSSHLPSPCFVVRLFLRLKGSDHPPRMARPAPRSNSILDGIPHAPRPVPHWRRPFAGDASFIGNTTADGATAVVLNEDETTTLVRRCLRAFREWPRQRAVGTIDEGAAPNGVLVRESMRKLAIVIMAGMFLQTAGTNAVLR